MPLGRFEEYSAPNTPAKTANPAIITATNSEASRKKVSGKRRMR